MVKYADNVLKGFATSISILISCGVSMYVFQDVAFNMGFVVGALVVLSAVYTYGMAPRPGGGVMTAVGGGVGAVLQGGGPGSGALSPGRSMDTKPLSA